MNACSGSRSVATLANLPLSVSMSEEMEWLEEPMSPVGRVMEDMGIHIVAILGLGKPLNLPVFRAGVERDLLPRYPRFSSIQVILIAICFFHSYLNFHVPTNVNGKGSVLLMIFAC
jgi:hypothetical protein